MYTEDFVTQRCINVFYYEIYRVNKCMFTPVLFYLGFKKSGYPSFLLCYNHIVSMFDVILTKISLAMKIFESQS